ncbi:MAG: gamma-glutamyl-gamma-aminobutyrate hydrolase family protein [Clostridia bacterium]|nr:gamma-glutamyl-gamma-aminobutyrate hydrolase family protein [Clostridia bacterium]
MAKKIIGVVPLLDEEKESIWMLPGYMDGIMDAGAIPVILPMTDNAEDLKEIFSLCDGLLMTGGQDVSPAMYRAKRSPQCGASCDTRDRMEKLLYEMAVEEEKPVLGICRGIQIINVLQGGTLYQDIPSEYHTGIEHHMKPPYTDTAHSVRILNPSPLYSLLGTESLGVNSYHHQAVKDLGQGLEVMAISEDGLVEAISRKGSRFVWGIQWHPEFNFHVDGSSRKIFKAFINACGQRSELYHPNYSSTAV